MAWEFEQYPPSLVDRAWLRRHLDVPDADPERLVDIVHARYCTEPPTSRELLARTLAVSPATIGKRERAALARLRRVPIDDLEGGEGLRPGTRLHAAVQTAPETEPLLGEEAEPEHAVVTEKEVVEAQSVAMAKAVTESATPATEKDAAMPVTEAPASDWQRWGR